MCPVFLVGVSFLAARAARNDPFTPDAPPSFRLAFEFIPNAAAPGSPRRAGFERLGVEVRQRDPYHPPGCPAWPARPIGGETAACTLFPVPYSLFPDFFL